MRIGNITHALTYFDPRNMTPKTLSSVAVCAAAAIGSAFKEFYPKDFSWLGRNAIITLPMSALVVGGWILNRKQKGNAPSQQPTPLKDFEPVASYGGAVIGIAGGSLAKASISESIHAKNLVMCRGAYSGMPILMAINSFKQAEIKNCGYIIPFIPAAGQMLLDSYYERDQMQSSIIAVPKKFIGKLSEVSGTKIAYTGALIAGTFLMNNYVTQVSKEMTGIPFDVSGHVITKLTLGTCFSNSLSSALETSGKWQTLGWLGFGLGVLVTDCILMHNTATFCHSLPEIATGVIASGCVHAAATVISQLPDLVL